MRKPRIRLWVLMIAVVIVAGLLGWERRQARTIHAPDIIAVDARSALPGRPIRGERLVRPDGTISLGYYGGLAVAGLTPEEAKARVVTHLRRYLSDEALGLAEPVTGPGGRRSVRRISPYRTDCVSVRVTTRNSGPRFVERAARYVRKKAGLPDGGG